MQYVLNHPRSSCWIHPFCKRKPHQGNLNSTSTVLHASSIISIITQAVGMHDLQSSARLHEMNAQLTKNQNSKWLRAFLPENDHCDEVEHADGRSLATVRSRIAAEAEEAAPAPTPPISVEGETKTCVKHRAAWMQPSKHCCLTIPV